jgi:hypothetical protein
MTSCCLFTTKYNSGASSSSGERQSIIDLRSGILLKLQRGKPGMITGKGHIKFHSWSGDFCVYSSSHSVLTELLNTDWKKHWSENCNDNLEFFKQNTNTSFLGTMTGDEMLVHQRDPETKQDTTQWKHQRSSKPHKILCPGICWQGCDHYVLGL